MWIIDMLTSRKPEGHQARADLATVLSGGLVPFSLPAAAQDNREDRRYS